MLDTRNTIFALILYKMAWFEKFFYQICYIFSSVFQFQVKREVIKRNFYRRVRYSSTKIDKKTVNPCDIRHEFTVLFD